MGRIYRYRLRTPISGGWDWRAQDAKEATGLEVPYPRGLVLGRGDQEALGRVDADATDGRRVHAGLDAQDRLARRLAGMRYAACHQ